MRAAYDSIRGPITVEWRRTDSGLDVEVGVPANTTAEVHLPVADRARVTESGRSLADAGAIEGLIGVRQSEGGLIVDIGSGRYRFAAQLP